MIDCLNCIFAGISGHLNVLFASLSDGGWFLTPGNGIILAFALAAAYAGGLSEGVLAGARRWHGNISEQFAAIDNLTSIIQANQPAWTIPAEMLSDLVDRRDRLQTLVNKCRTPYASHADREQRNALLKSTVGLCVMRVKIWAYAEFDADVLTAEDVHNLGFLLPGEAGGTHLRGEATDVKTEVKVTVINEDFIRVVIDQSAGENAAPIRHGWPQGIRQALIVITAADGRTEVVRQFTPRLHTDIEMPAGSHGKQFIIKAAFLRHIDDAPRFGNEPTFSMPLTTEDLAALIDHQHHSEFEEQMREVERQRREIEELRAALAAGGKK
ncbi:MAG: hypothetical protein LBH72_03495 [Proteiniphilum sp.]|jgi:hypothetical protein|nr:hypothetical protein [Proteiniphilum sp.]